MQAPDPLVPPEVDLRNFGFMPLEVLRLRDSDLASAASGDEFKAAVLLWCAAWHQVPAGSVPNSDRWLATHSGAGPNWLKVKKAAMRGFIECSDGRLYHEVVSEKALESWKLKKSQRERTRQATEARLQRNVQRNEPRNDSRNVDRNVHQGIGSDRIKDLNTCAYLNCKAIGTRSRSTNGGPWYCSEHYDAVFHGIEPTAPPGKFDH